MGNTELVEYGIQTERSHWRIHVCFKARHAYVYETSKGVEAMERVKLEEPSRSDLFKRHQFVRRDGRIVGEGWLVEPDEIEACGELPIPSDIRDAYKPDWNASEGSKGEAAVNVVREMLKRSSQLGTCTSVWLAQASASRVLDVPPNHNLQIEGVDLVYRTDVRIQVKCDYPGGQLERGGTGYLFLQTHECNPDGIH